MGQTCQDDTRTELSRPGEPGLTRMVKKGIQQQHNTIVHYIVILFLLLTIIIVTLISVIGSHLKLLLKYGLFY